MNKVNANYREYKKYIETLSETELKKEYILSRWLDISVPNDMADYKRQLTEIVKNKKAVNRCLELRELCLQLYEIGDELKTYRENCAYTYADVPSDFSLSEEERKNLERASVSLLREAVLTLYYEATPIGEDLDELYLSRANIAMKDMERIGENLKASSARIVWDAFSLQMEEEPRDISCMDRAAYVDVLDEDESWSAGDLMDTLYIGLESELAYCGREWEGEYDGI